MTPACATVLYIKCQLDKMLINRTHNSITYRVTIWDAIPALAAVGMRLIPGPGDKVDWYGSNVQFPAWILLLPQDHGYTLITASAKGTEEHTTEIHEGLPKTERGILKKGISWTRMMCKKVLSNSTDIAISHKRFFQAGPRERGRLQEYLFSRTVERSRKRINELPNLLDTRDPSTVRGI